MSAASLRRSFRYVLMGLSISWLACDESPAAREPSPAGDNMAVIEVELDAFSGLPNPRWRLAPQDAETAAALFQGLGESTSQQALFDGLGYRGLRVRGLPGQADVVVWNEIVETRQGGKTLRWYDKDRAFERYLLGTAESQLNDSTARGVIETVVRQIDD